MEKQKKVINIQKIKGLMAEHDEKVKDMSVLLSLSAQSCYLRLRNEVPFQISEIKALSSHYNVPITYFFEN